jgi:hypothetical protein
VEVAQSTNRFRDLLCLGFDFAGVAVGHLSVFWPDPSFTGRILAQQEGLQLLPPVVAAGSVEADLLEPKDGRLLAYLQSARGPPNVIIIGLVREGSAQKRAGVRIRN